MTYDDLPAHGADEVDDETARRRAPSQPKG